MHVTTMGLWGLRKLGFNSHNDRWRQADSVPISASKDDVHQVGLINILIGPNGGGKSTIADLIRSLVEPSVLTTLVRENMRMDTRSGFELVFDNRAECRCEFNKLGIDEVGVATLSGGRSFRGRFSLNPNTPMPAGLTDALTSLGVVVNYRNRHDEEGIPVAAWVDQLNKHVAHLIGVGEYPLDPDQSAYQFPPVAFRHIAPAIMQRDGHPDTLTVRLNDDPLQHNHIKISALPSGWRAFAGLLAWLTALPEGSIAVIEEPETHLHATLQRVLIREVLSIARQRQLQVFVTTHAPALVDFTVRYDDMQLFSALGWRIESLSDAAAAVQSVGESPSTACFANGLIWVEGPSDRIYLLHWLSLWCAQNGRAPFIENEDFSVFLYGGSLLSHYSAAPTVHDKIAMFKINPNAFLLMDRDCDFSKVTDGIGTPINHRNTKAIIQEQFCAYKVATRRSWVTSKYTIESYLPKRFRERNFQIKRERLVPRRGKKKVPIANAFVANGYAFTTAHDNNGLPDLISALIEAMVHWRRT